LGWARATGAATAALPTSPLADRVPGDALIYLGWTGFRIARPGVRRLAPQSRARRLGHPEFFQTFLQQLIERVGPKEPQAAQVMQLVSAIGGPMWRHPSALYFGGIDWGTGGGQPLPRLALLCDAGPEADRLATALTRIVAQIPPDGPAVTAKQYGSLVVVAFGPALAVDQLFAHPNAAEALAQSPAFTAAIAQTHNQPLLVGYVDMQRIVKATDETIQHINQPEPTAIWPKVRDALGLGGITQGVWTSGFDGKDWCEESFVGTNGGKAGLLALLNASPLTDDALAAVPKSANRVMAGISIWLAWCGKSAAASSSSTRAWPSSSTPGWPA